MEGFIAVLPSFILNCLLEALCADDEAVDDHPGLVPVKVLHLDQHLLGLHTSIDVTYFGRLLLSWQRHNVFMPWLSAVTTAFQTVD